MAMTTVPLETEKPHGTMKEDGRKNRGWVCPFRFLEPSGTGGIQAAEIDLKNLQQASDYASRPGIARKTVQLAHQKLRNSTPGILYVYHDNRSSSDEDDEHEVHERILRFQDSIIDAYNEQVAALTKMIDKQKILIERKTEAFERLHKDYLELQAKERARIFVPRNDITTLIDAAGETIASMPSCSMGLTTMTISSSVCGKRTTSMLGRSLNPRPVKKSLASL